MAAVISSNIIEGGFGIMDSFKELLEKDDRREGDGLITIFLKTTVCIAHFVAFTYHDIHQWLQLLSFVELGHKQIEELNF